MWTLMITQEIGSLYFTLLFRFVNEQRKQKATFLVPEEEPLMREFFTDGTAYSTHLERASVIFIHNIAIENIPSVRFFESWISS